MSTNNRARLQVATLIFSMVNAVMFGLGVIAVLSTPILAQRAFFWIPAIVVVSFMLSPLVAWFIAPSMMQRFLKAQSPPLTARLARLIESEQ